MLVSLILVQPGSPSAVQGAANTEVDAMVRELSVHADPEGLTRLFAFLERLPALIPELGDGGDADETSDEEETTEEETSADEVVGGAPAEGRSGREDAEDMGSMVGMVIPEASPSNLRISHPSCLWSASSASDAGGGDHPASVCRSMSGRRSPKLRQGTGSRKSVLGSAVQETRRATSKGIGDMWSKLNEDSLAVGGAEELHPTLRLAARVECLRVLVHSCTPPAWPHGNASLPTELRARGIAVAC